MKKVFMLLTVLLSVFILSACETIEVVPEKLNVVFENPRYKDNSFFIDTYITNGFSDDMDVGYMDFGIYPIGSDLEVAGAGFNMDLTIKAGEYIFVELEFGSDYVFISEEELTDLGFSVDELELYFWFS